jgi:hypothetical protein
MNPLRLMVPPLRRIAGVFRTTRRTVAMVPDAIEAILMLPELSRQLEAVRFSTATLPEMLEEIRRVQGDTSALPEMQEELERMGRVTAWVPPRRRVRVSAPRNGS